MILITGSGSREDLSAVRRLVVVESHDSVNTAGTICRQCENAPVRWYWIAPAAYSLRHRGGDVEDKVRGEEEKTAREEVTIPANASYKSGMRRDMTVANSNGLLEEPRIRESRPAPVDSTSGELGIRNANGC